MLRTLLHSIPLLYDRIMHTPRPVFQEVAALRYEDPQWVEHCRVNAHNLLFYPGDISLSPISSAYTQEKMTLWRHNQSDVPLVMQGRIHHDDLPNTGRASIKGNLFLLKNGAFDDLDSAMQNGVNFERKKVIVNLPLIDWEGNPTQLSARMYVAMPEVRANILWDVAFNRNQGEFSLADKLNDTRRWIRRFYQHHANYGNVGVLNKCFLYVHRGLSDPAPIPKPEPPAHRVHIAVEAAVPTK